MKTITINVNEQIEGLFRELAAQEFGARKGYLGKAITDAMHGWVHERKQKKVAAEAMQLMQRGFDLGKWQYKTREELHER